MADEHRYSEWSPVSRRQAILGIGTVAAGSTALATVTTDRAAAQVSVESLSIPDASFTAESITPELAVTIGFSYDVGDEAVGSLRFGLAVDGTEIDSEELNTTKATFEGETSLAGLLTDSDAWASGEFTVGIGESVSQEISATVTFEVRDGTGGVLIDDSANETVVVSVSHPQETTWNASVGGVGEITDANQ